MQQRWWHCLLDLYPTLCAHRAPGSPPAPLSGALGEVDLGCGDWPETETGRGSIRVNDEAGEGAVLVAVASVRFAPVQLDEDLIPCIQVQDDTIAGVVVVLVGVLGDGAGSYLEVHRRRE